MSILITEAILQVGEVEIKYPEFEIKWSFDTNVEKNTSILKISIANLSETTRSLININDPVTFSFGRNKEVGIFTSGYVLKIINDDKNSTTKWLKLEIAGEKIGLFDDISISYGEGVRSDYIIKDMAKRMGLNIQSFEIVNNKSYSLGYCVYGKAFQELKKVVEDTESKMQLINDNLYVFINEGVGENKGIFLSYSTGLLSHPSVVNERDKKYDFKLKALAYHQLKIDSVFALGSDVFNGYVKIKKISIKDFVAEYYVEVVER